MKSRKFTLAIICLSICLGTFVFVSNVDARGLLRSREICWQVVRDGELHFTLRLAVTLTGKRHFLLNGYAIMAEDQAILPYMATGEIVDGQFLMTGTTALSQPEMMVQATRTFTLDLPSLNGTSESLLTIYNKGYYEVSHQLSTGAVKRIPCRCIEDD